MKEKTRQRLIEEAMANTSVTVVTGKHAEGKTLVDVFGDRTVRYHGVRAWMCSSRHPYIPGKARLHNSQLAPRDFKKAMTRVKEKARANL